MSAWSNSNKPKSIKENSDSDDCPSNLLMADESVYSKISAAVVDSIEFWEETRLLTFHLLKQSKNWKSSKVKELRRKLKQS
jgi:hypothetical protein